jgi:NTP pyrophosphatase (non-canonical NTP hydrolase)
MNVIDQITAEVARATVKFPTWPTDPLHALAVLGEEFGELTKAMLQHTYEPHKGVTQQDIREEVIQTAAMALRLALSLDSYEYRRGAQHKQGSEGCNYHERNEL